MAKTTFSPFYSAITSDDIWNFKGPNGIGLSNKGGFWNWSKLQTPTSGTGPSTGHTHGYVYIETNAPTKCGDTFEMVTEEVFDFSYKGSVSFYYNANVQAVKLYLEIWDGLQWINEYSEVPIPKNEWVFIDVNLNRYTNLDSRVKFKITILDCKKVFKNDFALDTISIESFGEILLDNVDAYVESKNFKRLKKGRIKKRYISDTLSKEEIKINISEIEQQIENGTLVLEEDLIIHESESVSHLIKKKG